MELLELNYFLAVAERQSYSLAAEDENISQSSLSKAILRLEEELNVELFDRKKRPIELTAAGKCFCEDAKEILARYNAALEHIRAFSGRMQIKCLTVPAQFPLHMNLIIRQFNDENPDINVQTADMHFVMEAIEKLKNGEADCVIAHRPFFPDDAVEETILAYDQVCVAVPLNHRFAGRESLTLKELNGEKFMETVFGNDIVNGLILKFGFKPGEIKTLKPGSRRENMFSELNYENCLSICFKSDVKVFQFDDLKVVPLSDLDIQPFVLLERADMVERAYHLKFKKYFIERLSAYRK